MLEDQDSRARKIAQIKEDRLNVLYSNRDFNLNEAPTPNSNELSCLSHENRLLKDRVDEQQRQITKLLIETGRLLQRLDDLTEPKEK